MKSQNGVTLISLTIYIIVMTIVMTVVSLIGTYFYKNTRSLSNATNPTVEYTRFINFFNEEINHRGIKILECKENYIAFDNKIQYTYVPENKAIYQNKVKIASDIENCQFKASIINGKDIVTVTIKMKDKEIKTVEYTLKK